MKKDKKPDKGKKEPRYEITELFMARAGKKNWEKCFHGTINREKDENGKEIAISGKITVNEGAVWARAENQDSLGEKLDELVTLVVFNRIHESPGISADKSGKWFIIN